MEIKKVIPSGFCIGVIEAIKKVKELRKDEPNAKIYILGHLVHNEYISDALSKMDIITLDDKDKSKEELIEMIDDGIIVFSAHGISDDLYKKAKEKGLRILDATCPFVYKTQCLIKDRLKEGYEVLYIGKDKHPEAMAVLSISPHIHLIEDKSSLNDLQDYSKVFITNQTTMSITEIELLVNIIKERYPKAVFSDEICSATRMRQEAIYKITDADVLYVVGDPTSNNSNKLKEIAKSRGIKKVYLIRSAQDIDIQDLKDVSVIYVTSGASTPNYLRDQVIEVLKEYDKKGTFKVPEIILSKLI